MKAKAIRKITVKHYLEKRVKPFEEHYGLVYPVYVQITIDRRTTQYRSISHTFLTEHDFEKYINQEDYYCDFRGYAMYTKDFFEKEVERIEKSFEHMIKEYEYFHNLEGKPIKFDSKLISDMYSYIPKFYLKWTRQSFITLCWRFFFSQKGKIDMYRFFSRDSNLITNLNYLKKQFNVDLKSQIPIGDVIFWGNIEVLIDHYGDQSVLIDLIGSYREVIKKSDKIKNKEIFTNQVGEITKHLKYTNW